MTLMAKYNVKKCPDFKYVEKMLLNNSSTTGNGTGSTQTATSAEEAVLNSDNQNLPSEGGSKTDSDNSAGKISQCLFGMSVINVNPSLVFPMRASSLYTFFLFLQLLVSAEILVVSLRRTRNPLQLGFSEIKSGFENKCRKSCLFTYSKSKYFSISLTLIVSPEYDANW